jgi:hypothetical protein
LEDCVYVYFVSASTAQWQRVKIGKAKDVRKRISELQTGCPTELRLLGTIRADSDMHAMQMESDLHSRFSGYAVGGEWFQLTAPLREFINASCSGSHEEAAKALRWANRQMRGRAIKALKYGPRLR